MGTPVTPVKTTRTFLYFFHRSIITFLYLFLIQYSPLVRCQTNQSTTTDTTTTSSNPNTQLLNQVSSVVQGAGSALSNFGKQFAQGFGYCPSGYTYNMSVWNDLNQPITAALQSVVQVQGADFNASLSKSATLQPYSSDSSTFSQVPACHDKVWLSTSILSSSTGSSSPIDQLQQGVLYTNLVDIVSGDTNVYYYHSYSQGGTPDGEFIGPNIYGGPYSTTSEFNGVFFNNSTNPLSFTFTKNGTPYTVTLEPDSFTLLASDPTQTNSIRNSSGSSIFTFSLGSTTVTVPIAAQGIGQSLTTPGTSTSQVVPLTNTYELISSNNTPLTAGIQGFNLGNYNQVGVSQLGSTLTATNQLAPMRDVNPIPCHVWFQSPSQYQQAQASSSSTTSSTDSSSSSSTTTQNTTLIPYQLPGTVWAFYKTHDSTVTTQINPGAVTSFNVLRPQVSEESGNLYIFALDTQESSKAQAYLTTIATNPTLLTSHKVISSVQNPLDIQSFTQALQGKGLPSSNGIIYDKQSGVTGALLVTDVFVPYGSGTPTDRYYIIPPALLKLDSSFAGIFLAHLNIPQQNSQEYITTMTNQIIQAAPGWLTTYAANQNMLSGSTITSGTAVQNQQVLENLVPDLTTFLTTNGAPTLFTTTQNTTQGTTQGTDQSTSSDRTFSPLGIQALYLVLLGPISIANPPLIRQSGTNAYLAGGKPADWPSS